MSDIIFLTNAKTLIDTEHIQALRVLSYQGDFDEVLSGRYMVRVYFKVHEGRCPFIDLLFDSLTEAKHIYRSIIKSRSVVNIKDLDPVKL